MTLFFPRFVHQHTENDVLLEYFISLEFAQQQNNEIKTKSMILYHDQYKTLGIEINNKDRFVCHFISNRISKALITVQYWWCCLTIVNAVVLPFDWDQNNKLNINMLWSYITKLYWSLTFSSSCLLESPNINYMYVCMSSVVISYCVSKNRFQNTGVFKELWEEFSIETRQWPYRADPRAYCEVKFSVTSITL